MKIKCSDCGLPHRILVAQDLKRCLRCRADLQITENAVRQVVVTDTEVAI